MAAHHQIIIIGGGNAGRSHGGSVPKVRPEYTRSALILVRVMDR